MLGRGFRRTLGLLGPGKLDNKLLYIILVNYCHTINYMLQIMSYLKIKRERKKPAPNQRGGPMRETGDGLLSHKVSLAVPSALTGLTAVFGMGTGVTLSLWPPRSVVNEEAPRGLQSKHERSIQALGRLVPVG